MKVTEAVDLLRESSNVLSMLAILLEILDEHKNLDVPEAVANDMLSVKTGLDTIKLTLRLMAKESAALNEGEDNE